MSQVSASPGTSKIDNTPDEYDVLEACLKSTAKDVLGDGVGKRLFTTNATGLFDTFLEHLPGGIRQAHTCHCCRRFFETFGGLVVIDVEGRTHPLLWNEAEVPALYAPAVAAVAREIARARVNGVFFSDEKTWGTPRTGMWSHMHVDPPAAIVFGKDGSLQSPDQVSAQKSRDREMLHRALAEFPLNLCVQAEHLLTTSQLARSEKHAAAAKWLVELHQAHAAAKGSTAKDNVVWKAAASAPAGFCHVRSGMIGTLLEDLASGMDVGAVSRRFAEKMDPLQYQRATAPLSEGNRARAEKVIAELGVARSLERRFAFKEEVDALWRPTDMPAPVKTGGVFDHLAITLSKREPPAPGPAIPMTWEKFARTVLPEATKIAYHVSYAQKAYFGLVTAAHPDAPPILQWDSLEKRNPLSWYFYNGGSIPTWWNLAFGAYVPVTAICLQPSMSVSEHQGKAAFFLLEGARDTRHVKSGGFFTETLKSELHEIRATLEAYMLEAAITGAKEATACGVALQGGDTRPSDLVFRVTTKNGMQTDYKLDRWD